MANKIGIPTMGGVGGALGDFAVGMGGGIAYRLSQALLGSGLIGGIAAAGIAGAMVKGVRGTAIATILGFQSIIGSATTTSQPAQSGRGVM